MIHALTDLEPLIQQYDHEKILVGPLFNLWTNSRFRAFNIAGKSGKIYETIGLGFFEVEGDAQRRRSKIVAALEDCFGEVEIFDKQLEMAQMAHTLWANDETAKFLATVSWESKARPTRETRQKQNLADPNKVRVLSGLRDLPAVAGRSLSKKYGLWALSGVAACFALSFVVGFLIGMRFFTNFGSMRQTANEATLSHNAAASITGGHDASQVPGTLTHPIPASSIGTANREAELKKAARVASPSLADGGGDAAPFPGAQPPENRSDQAEAAPDEQLSHSSNAQANQADGSISLPQSSPPETVKTQSSAAETVPLSIPRPEAAPTEVFVSPASTQMLAGHDGPQLLPSEVATPKAPEALSISSQRQASNSAIVPLPRPRPAVNAVSTDRPHHRIGPSAEGARSPLFGLFGH